MKTIGLIGGMSWESTLPYYRRINELVSERLGGLHSARIVLVSLDFSDVEVLQTAGEWDEAGRLLADAARSVQAAGAECVLVASNTMHRVASWVEDAVDIPLLHIADATAAAVRQAGLTAVGLLGTRFTMEQDFYRSRLEDRFGLSVVVPDDADRAFVDRVIYTELCCGIVSEASRETFREIIGRLVARGAEGVILGCTEIPMLVSSADSPVPVFDTGEIHAASAVRFALGDTHGADGGGV
ncbi:MAG: aspartate/glutamate racemase family protein [Coriobacteriia bacterium]|nr:aspartate/glutamate racemase family protein [Coriobacteriia bacterium]